MGLDDLLHSHIGEFGRYQRILFFLICIPTIFNGLHSLSWTFTGIVVPHRCKQPSENASALFSSPPDPQPTLNTNCSRFNPLLGPNRTEACLDGYIWADDRHSATKRWSLVCERGYIRAFIQSVYYVGQFFGSFVFGYCADRLGRKKAFIFAILLTINFGTWMAFVPTWQLFALLRCCLGFVHPGIFVLANVIGMELVGPSKRKLAGIMTRICFESGQIVLGLSALLFSDYKTLQIVISLPAIFLLVYWWLMPESPRWLISLGRIDKAGKILQTAAKVNKVQLPDDFLRKLSESSTVQSDDTEAPGIWKQLRENKRLRSRALIVFFCWASANLTYYGISMNPAFMGGSLHLTFNTGAVMSIFGILVVYFTVEKCGRRALTIAGFFLTGLAMLSTLLIPTGMDYLRVAQVLLSKTTITGTYTLLYIYTPELFPTGMRATLVGCCSMLARLGSVSASYVAMWIVYKSRILAVLVFGLLTVVAGLLTLLLPETTGRPLPETIHDIQPYESPVKQWRLRRNNSSCRHLEEYEVTQSDAEDT